MLLRIILFFAFINFIAKMGGYGMMPALILGRTGNDQSALGMVEAAAGVGTLVGSVFVTLLKPAKSRTRIIFISCGLSFFIGDVGQSLTHTLPLWILTAFASHLPLAFVNANLTVVMRTNVPIYMHGRVFSARDTIQYSTIPIGLFLGGILTDHIFEPFMATPSPFQEFLSTLFGTGKASGVALIFFIVGMLGLVTNLMCLKNPIYKSLDEKS